MSSSEYFEKLPDRSNELNGLDEKAVRIQQNPMFRKAIVPWYDSETACLIVIVFMFLVFLFGFAGISVAREHEEYLELVWVAMLLVIMSGTVIVSTTVRLIKRYAQRFPK